MTNSHSFIFIYFAMFLHQSVLPKGRSSTANSGTKIAVLLWMNRCSSFPLISAPHSLFSISTGIERSEKIPGAPAWRSGEWIWLTGTSGLHRNSPHGLNISSIRAFDQGTDLSYIKSNLKHYWSTFDKWTST